MLAFAGNSLLCRQALLHSRIDPASFSTLRLVSGAVILALILHLRTGARGERPDAGDAKGRWAGRWDGLAATMLFAYVACFSFAYRWLDAASGALILFGAVQVTMIGAGLRAREPFAPLAWVGALMSLAGLVFLVSPGLSAPEPLGAALMALAGLAWGVYSLRGRAVADPLAATAGNFLLAAPMALLLSAALWSQTQVDLAGAMWAVLSGAVTSGLGYVLWYAAVPRLGALRAAIAQLSVPPVAALGGVLWLAEPVTARLLLASLAILGGIALVLAARARPAS